MSNCRTSEQFGSSFKGNYEKVWSCSTDDLYEMQKEINGFLEKNKSIDIVFTVTGRVETTTGNYKTIIFYKQK